MRNRIWMMGALMVAAAGSLAAGPRGARSGGWGPDGAYCRQWDAKTIETIRGEVTKIERFAPMHGMSQGVIAEVKTEKETVSIHLGPAWFIDKQDLTIEAKDSIEVTGSRLELEGKPAILAQTVKKGDATLTLRDTDGIPVWAPVHGMKPAGG